MNIQSAKLTSNIPFDSKKLDDLLEQAGIDVLVATSKHNVGYLLGGYRFFFFETMDPIGISRYLPVFLYFKGKAEQSVFLGNRLEGFEKQNNRFWTPVADPSHMTSVTSSKPRSRISRRWASRPGGSASRCRFC